MSRHAYLILTLVVAAAWPTSAQDAPNPAAAKEAIAAISFLQGDWEGEGWIRRGPGEPQRFRSSEKVVARLDGVVLAVEGKHWSKDTNQVVHEAFAVISHDPAGGYKFESWLATGQSGSYKGRVESGAFVWEMSPPMGKIRYTIKVENATWTEVGQFSRDGVAWQPFFEMTLKRK